MDNGTATDRLVCSKSQALPWLIAARHSGHLVPFVGAGMSMPFCTGWINFIRELCTGFGHDMMAFGLHDTIDTERLYRVADRVASWLRLLPLEERRQRLVSALRPKSGSRDADLPPQLKALATVNWPLIVTTNYDDLIVAAIEAENQEQQHGPGLPGPLLKPLVLGRSSKDCVEVVRSLDNLRPPLVWHVQGHIPGVAGRADGKQASSEVDALLDQVVLGHQQYQQAINAEPAFRRAFAEVFRRRSLLFLGSGLAESYVVNLISEALFGFGPSTRSHYALFTRNELRAIDTEFLAMRLGITPIEYGESHEDLPAVIREIAQVSDNSTTSLSGISFKVKPTFQVEQVEVCLSKGDLPAPVPLKTAEPGQCVIVSIGLDPHAKGGFRPYLNGAQAASFLRAYGAQAAPEDCAPVTEHKPSRIFRFVQGQQKHPVFFAASSIADVPGQPDTRDLQTISDVTFQALQAAAAQGFTAFSMGLIGAGDVRPADPAHCLLAQLSGIRAFLETSPNPAVVVGRIEVHIRDDLAWMPLAHGRIPAAELLSSGLARVLARISDGHGRYEEFALSVPHQSKVRDVLQGYSLGKLERLNISVSPLTRLRAEEALEVRVFPGMTVEVSPTVSASPQSPTKAIVCVAPL